MAAYAMVNFCTFHAALVKPLGWRPEFKVGQHDLLPLNDNQSAENYRFTKRLTRNTFYFSITAFIRVLLDSFYAWLSCSLCHGLLL